MEPSSYRMPLPASVQELTLFRVFRPRPSTLPVVLGAAASLGVSASGLTASDRLLVASLCYSLSKPPQVLDIKRGKTMLRFDRSAGLFIPTFGLPLLFIHRKSIPVFLLGWQSANSKLGTIILIKCIGSAIAIPFNPSLVSGSRIGIKGIPYDDHLFGSATPWVLRSGSGSGMWTY